MKPNTPKQQQKQKPKKNITNITNVTNKPQTMLYKVPHCAEHYFDALVDPFSTEAGVCIPCDLFPLPSQKVRVVARGTFECGTTGHGWIVLRPPGANAEVCIRHTNANSVGTNVTVLNSFTNVTQLPIAGLPYSIPQLSESGHVEYRTVAIGLRAKYVGALMNRQGIIFGIEEPDHMELRNFTIDEISQYQYSSANRVGGGEWDSAVCYSGPTKPNQLEYVHYQELGTAQFMGLCVAGGIGDKYEYEIVVHNEYIGSQVPGRTPSHADAHAFGKVVEVTKTAAASQPLQPPMHRPLWERFKSAVAEGLPKLASGAVQVVSSAFSGDFTKLMSGANDLYKGVNPSIRALLETPAQRGHQVSSPYLALPPPKVLMKNR